MGNGDGLLMANFRADRARQILQSLVDPSFDEFERSTTVEFAARLGMVSYSDDLDAYFPVLFPATVLENVLGKTVSDAGLSQLRLAETEKYAHVTYFLNGGEESPFNREDRILVPSPKVATYDLMPEMSASELTDELVKALTQRTYDLIVINYANGDMVGHTGSLDAAIRAAEVLDGCLKRVLETLHQVDGTMLLTADHGNFELMRDPVTGGAAYSSYAQSGPSAASQRALRSPRIKQWPPGRYRPDPAQTSGRQSAAGNDRKRLVLACVGTKQTNDCFLIMRT